jgi:hypothetical protein
MLRHWPSHLERWVDRKFEHATAQAVRGECCQNPVTGSWFVFGRDPIGVQKEQALRAQRARWLFDATKPGNFPPLPVDEREWPRITYDNPADWLVVHYARSWRSNAYDLGHPDLATYAGGLRASDLITGPRVADFMRDGVEKLLDRFQPRPLPGLDEWLVWHPLPHPGSLAIPHRTIARRHKASARDAWPRQPKLYTIKPSSNPRPRCKRTGR